MTFTDSVYANDTAKKMRKLTKVKKGIYGYTDTGEVKYATIDYADGGGTNDDTTQTTVIDTVTIPSSDEYTNHAFSIDPNVIEKYDVLKIGISSQGTSLVKQISLFEGRKEFISNGGFEYIDDKGFAVGWNKGFFSSASITTFKHSGDSAVSLIHDTGMFSNNSLITTKSIITGETLKLTFYAYTNSSNTVITLTGIANENINMNTTKTWTKYERNIQGTGYLSFSATNGSFYLDDVSLIGDEYTTDSFASQDWENATYQIDDDTTVLKATTTVATKSYQIKSKEPKEMKIMTKGDAVIVQLLGQRTENKKKLCANSLNLIHKDMNQILGTSNSFSKRKINGEKKAGIIKW